MSSTNSDAPTPAVRSGIRWSTVLFGCALGCAGLIAVGVVAAILLWQWVGRAEPLPAESAFLDPSITAYLEASASADDPGMMAFLEALESANRSDNRVLHKALPVRFVALMAGPPEDPEYVAVLSLSRYTNILRLPLLPVSLARDQEGVLRYRDEAILRDQHHQSSPAFALVGGSLVFASGEAGAKRAIDRLKEQGPGQGSAAMEALWPRDAAHTVRGVLVNEHGELLRLLRLIGMVPPVPELPPLPPGSSPALPAGPVPSPPALTPEAPPESAPEGVAIELPPPPPVPAPGAAPRAFASARGLALRLSAGKPDAGSLEGSLELVYDGDAADHVAELLSFAPGFESWLREHGISTSVKLRVDGPRLWIEGRLDGVVQALQGRSIRMGPVEVK